MKELIRGLMNKKKVAIMGYGLEGQSTLRLLHEALPGQMIHILDKKTDIKKDSGLLNDPFVTLHLGEQMMENISDYDFIIKAPGIPKRELPESLDRHKITSQTDLFLRRYHRQVIGVTGTKGKSTTSSLIDAILRQAGIHSLLVGNIGIPPFDASQSIQEETIIVMELSSHQLEYLTHSPHIALLLNIFQEHLDHYYSFEDYQQAKFNIALYQQADDYFIYSSENDLVSQWISRMEFPQHLLPYSIEKPAGDGIFFSKGQVILRQGELSQVIHHKDAGNHLKGEHNFTNIMAAAAAGRLAGADIIKTDLAISQFKGLEHRIEFVGDIDGILFYNDSIATIPEATMEAVKALKIVDTLILGGFDRGIDYSMLYPFLSGSSIRNLIFVGEAGRRMHAELDNTARHVMNTYDSENYDEVVQIAKSITAKGMICLLSPAASSYDMFRNFEHRGNIFKTKVRS